MKERHAYQVWARLDQLYTNGTTYLSWQEIYNWYNVDRISKAPWRDLRERWQKLEDDKGEEYVDPMTTETSGGITLFIPKSPKKLSELAD